MLKLEKEVSKDVKKSLLKWKSSGEIINFHRLNSGNVETKWGSHVYLGDEDTPDWIALVRNSDKSISVVYVEVKREHGGRLTDGQVLFSDKYNKLKDVYVLKITDAYNLDAFINYIAIDRIKEMPDQIG